MSTFILQADDAPRRNREPVQLSEAALKLHAECLVVDGHNDLPWRLRSNSKQLLIDRDLRQPQKDFHTDIPRLRQGGVGAQFWSAWVPSTPAKRDQAVQMTLEQIDVIHRLVRQYPDVFEMADKADDVERIHRSGKIASMIGVEGGHSINNSLAVLRLYYQLGVRYMTLTHSDNVDWADSATDTPKLHGLSPFGEQVVYEMNRLGMLVDISHVSPDVMKHVLRISQAPVIASHSSAYAIAQHPRNVPDDVLELIKKNHGVVMVNFYSGFIVPEAARVSRNMFQVGRQLREKYSDDEQYRLAWEQWFKDNPFPRGHLHMVVDHIDHLVRVAGVDHVGLGSDYDGITHTPEQLEDVSKYPYITQELLNRGYSADDIRKILGGNVLRVLRQAERIAQGNKKPS